MFVKQATVTAVLAVVVVLFSLPSVQFAMLFTQRVVGYFITITTDNIRAYRIGSISISRFLVLYFYALKLFLFGKPTLLTTI